MRDLDEACREVLDQLGRCIEITYEEGEDGHEYVDFCELNDEALSLLRRFVEEKQREQSEADAKVCEERSESLIHQSMRISEGNEASKCASAIRHAFRSRANARKEPS